MGNEGDNSGESNADKLTHTIESITALMLSANVAIPLVASAVGAIVLIIRSHLGNKGPKLSDVANVLEAQIKKTGATLDTNLAAAIRASLGVA